MTRILPGGALADLFADYEQLVSQLASDPSSLTALSRTFPKSLLIAAASSLEAKTKALLPELFERHGREELGSFVEKHVVARGFHTLFDWRNKTAASFFVLFGKQSKTRFRELLDGDEEFSAGHAGFMELGSARNETVHGDYAAATMALTPDEIRNYYLKALVFVARIEEVVIID